MHDKLLNTINRLLEDRPINQITINDIAQEAGVSRQTIYRNLGTKTDIKHLVHGTKPIKSDTRSEILDSANRVFSRYGFNQSSLDQVAYDAGFSKGAIYGHFNSKEELFIALIDNRLQQQVTYLSDELENLFILDSPKEGLVNFFEHQFKACESDPTWPKIVQEFMLHSRNKEIQHKLNLAQNRVRTQIVDLLEQLRASDRIDDEVDLSILTIMTTSLLDGLIMAWNLQPPQISAKRYAQEIAYILWHGISPKS